MADPDRMLVAEFAEEAREHLEVIADGLLRMESAAADSDTVNEVFRALHTIKGVSSFLGLTAINRLSHAGENLLDAVRKGTASPAADVVDPLLQTCDLLSELVIAAEAGEDRGVEEAKFQRLIAALDARLRNAGVNQASSTEASATWPAPGVGGSPELVAQFRAESVENLLEIEEGLLRLERDPRDLDTIHAVFRAMHSIKGTADYAGLAQIKTLAHHVETLLGAARDQRLSLAPPTTALIFEAFDELGELIAGLDGCGEPRRDLTGLVGRLVAAAETGSDQQPLAQPRTAVHSPLAVFLDSATQHVECIAVQAANLLLDPTAADALPTLRRGLQTLHNAADYMERAEFVAPAEALLQSLEPLKAGGEIDQSLREEICRRTRNLQACLAALQDEVAHGNRPPPSAAQPSPAVESASRPPAHPNSAVPLIQPPKSMRVDQAKLDEYVNLAGELTIARNMLTHIFEELEPTPAARRLKQAIEGVDRIAGAIQENAMAMRMVPVRTVFQRFPRVVRDIAQAKGKRIELQLFGEETELDKQVAEALGDPLIHLVRNSADHGIEAPDARKAAGKSETGLLTLRAAREGNHVLIDVIDDGAGIDVERLKAKAVASGRLTQEAADELPREDALRLIFAAGLSTAAQVTDVSGRGVGMDVVRTNIEKLSGAVAVTSEPGVGTQLRIELPLTLAVTRALLVETGGQRYAIPIDAVRETIKTPRERLRSLRGQAAVHLRERIVPVRGLANLLGGGASFATGSIAADIPRDETGRVPIAVVQVGRDALGLAVDRILGQQEIVLKPLPSALARLPGLGSATVMGDGSIVLILDPQSLYESACVGRAA